MIRKDALKQNIEIVEERIQNALLNSGRKREDIHLIVVTKTHSVDILAELLDLSIRDIGESYVQEGVEKKADIELLGNDYSDTRWHMIGHVQSRKALAVLDHFDLLHSVDSMKLANRLNVFAKEANKIFPILLQMNVSGEESKFGFDAKDQDAWGALTKKISDFGKLKNLAIKGLMSIPPYDPEQSLARASFSKTRNLRDHIASELPDLQLEHLSMGMSGDFESAILEGSTMLRLGTVILGPRSTN